MKDNITFAIISRYGCKISKITTTKNFIFTAALLSACVLVLSSVFIFKYIHMKESVSDTETLRRTVALQRHRIALHQKQIQLFTEELDSLKQALVELDEFEKKIRVVANVESKGEDQTNLFGIGGSTSEEPDIEDLLSGQMEGIHEQAGTLKTASIRKKADFADLLKQLEENADLLASTPSIFPANGQVTSGFGYRRSPFTAKRELHQGLDIGAPKGTEVVATADGVIAYAGSKGMLGRTIIIDHGHGIVTRYGHLYKILKTGGEKVKRGDVIARIGTSGRSTGYHLHYEVRINGIPVNPEKYIDPVVARSASDNNAS